MTAKFGPAGNCADFYATGKKSTVDMIRYVAAQGLTAYEYQCGRGVRLSSATAQELRDVAAECGVQLSLHAPYFISLASADPEKRDNSLRYIYESAAAVASLGGDRIVVHPGGLGGRTREEATALACETLARAQALLDEEGLSQVHICPETMGKIGQLGDLDEVLTMCGVDERFLPCIDFGHLNSRLHGGMNDAAAFSGALDAVAASLGEARARVFHAHFSKIEYTEGGEKRHLTFEDTFYGPEPAPLMQLIASRGLAPTLICESDGTQTRDAVTLSKLYREALQ